ncbi:ABC transporter substrate-binding protein [Jeotgalibacillus proteolyticus]|uniref:Sugar ABC transporter substrate-binding protein n=1 Tax=Jeotgalibacillus proteolyticus TaxID=2082395 RepID=A0A2S5G9N0_9BACL|nr:sugar ABC transporter substrate-binding protein [Jeotgalibacillus proteolyticus]PPA69634.1 sugar ABC transporter substrate-binding protein [Jeotgalibacillus proteolyticus]
MKLRVLLSGLFIVLILTGCSSDSGSGSNAGEDGEISGEITVAAWNLAADSLSETAENFMEEYPDATVTIEYTTSDYNSIIPPLTAGRGAPDIVQVQQRDFPNFMEVFDGQFIDITDRLGDRKSEFAEVAMNLVEKEDTVYAMPWDIGPVGMYYRKDMFEDAGIDPNEITTWDKYIEAGQKLQSELDGVKMSSHSLTNDDIAETYRMLMNQLGGQYYDENGNIQLVREENIQAMDMFKKMVDADLFLQAPTWDDRIRAFSNNQIATVLFPVWYAGTIKTQASDQQGLWGLMPMPAFTEGGPNQSHSGGSVLAISSQTENEALAWEFLEYTLMTNEGQDVQMEYGLFPSWQPYYETEKFSEEDEFFEIALSEFFGELSTDIPPIDYGSHFLDVNSAMADAIGEVVIDGKDIEAALRDAEKKVSNETGLEIAN